MSQPALTSFFAQSKRTTRSNRSGKVLENPAEVPPPTKRSTRVSKRETEAKIVVQEEPVIKETVKEAAPVPEKVDEEANVLSDLPVNVKEKPTKVVEDKVVKAPAKKKVVTKSSKKTKESEEPQETVENVEKVPEKDVVEEKPRTKRGRKKVIQEESAEAKDDCPSPAKRNRRNTDSSNNVEEALDAAKKLTASEVKQKLQGAKLSDLKQRLKKIEESSQSAKVKKAKAEVAAKKVAEDKAKQETKENYEQSPAYIRYHNLALKDVDGTLPLPYSYKFLDEVFSCVDRLTVIWHNRGEKITFEKLKEAVQKALRKNFTVGYLKQIKTVFPEAYKYAWEHIIGRYGKKLADYELNIAVNSKYKEEMIQRLGGGAAPADDVVAGSERVLPQSVVERGWLFKNSLLDLVKKQHSLFCAQLQPPVKVDYSIMKRFHKDFNVDECVAVEEAPDFPVKPQVEAALTASQVLEKSRALFEVNPKVSDTLAAVADKKNETEEKASSPAPQKMIRKELQGLPPKLLEKMLKMEAEKAAKDMLVDKVKDEKVRRLKRLPETARILKSIFVTENKAALLVKIVSKKSVESYKSNISEENMMKDIREMAKITGTWLTFISIQGNEYLKMNKAIEINNIVADLQKMLENEQK